MAKNFSSPTATVAELLRRLNGAVINGCKVDTKMAIAALEEYANTRPLPWNTDVKRIILSGCCDDATNGMTSTQQSITDAFPCRAVPETSDAVLLARIESLEAEKLRLEAELQAYRKFIEQVTGTQVRLKALKK